MLIETAGGKHLQLPLELVYADPQGHYHACVALGSVPDGAPSEDPMNGARTIPVIEESLEVQKRAVISGGVRIGKTIQERTETVDEPLFRDEVSVERRSVNRVVPETELPAVREEG
ncbi:MAG: YsnF/AvaK domain-containing protein, partial [Gammaproteobacteria bacterium]